MAEDLQEQLELQQQILIELEDELEMEISRVIALKNKIEPELIEELERVEEGLYVEVKMINETKNHVDSIIKKFKADDGTDQKALILNKKELEKIEVEVSKYKNRSEKLAKQLIEANEEIESLTTEMDKKLKLRENELKSDLINKLRDKDRVLSDSLMEAQKREEELLKQLEDYKKKEIQGPDEVQRVKSFFDKKIKNLKSTMEKDFKEREKTIAEKAIIVYNKKKEKIYFYAVKEALNMNSRPKEVERLIETLRKTLALPVEVYALENFILCNKCGDAVHISQIKCPSCKTRIQL